MRPFHNDALELLVGLSNQMFSAFITESIITTTVYLVQKDYSLINLNILLQTLNQKLKMLSCSNYLVTLALQSNPPDFEDALLYQVALHHQMDYFVTSNNKNFKKIQQAALPVIRAKELNKILLQ